MLCLAMNIMNTQGPGLLPNPGRKKQKKSQTRLPGAVPQPIGLFLFCIEFGWGWTKLIIDYCSAHESSSWGWNKVACWIWGSWVTIYFVINLLVGLKQGCILNLVEFGCVGAEKKWGSVLVWLWRFIRKIRPTQLLSWVGLWQYCLKFDSFWGLYKPTISSPQTQVNI